MTKSVLEVAGLIAGVGERAQQIVSFRAASTEVKLPLILVNGKEPGPTLVVTAGVHGSEYACVEAARRLSVEVAPENLHGQLIIVPSANPIAFRARSIYVSPPDGINPNRQFPGLAQGTFSQALAYWLFENIIRRADYYIDLHGGDMIEALIPFASCAVTGNATIDEAAEGMAQVFGLPYIALPTGGGSGIGGATHIAAAQAGIPALLAEAGGQGIWNEEEVDILLQGVVRVLASLRMVPEVQLVKPPTRLTAWEWLRSTNDGLYYPAVQIGDMVTAGQTVGRVTDFFGETLQVAQASIDGQVLFVVTSLAINAGDPLLCIAT